MKKLLLVVTLFIAVFALTACGGTEEEEFDYSQHTLTVYFVRSRPAE